METSNNLMWFYNYTLDLSSEDTDATQSLNASERRMYTLWKDGRWEA